MGIVSIVSYRGLLQKSLCHPANGRPENSRVSAKTIFSVIFSAMLLVLPSAVHADAAERSVADYGAVANDGHDDSAAFQKALEDITNTGRGRLRIPAGQYHFKQLVTVSASGGGIAVVGDGQGVSVLYGDNSKGVLRIINTSAKTQISIRDLSIFAARQGAGTAIEVSSSPSGSRNYRSLSIENVDIRGAGLPTKEFFDYGVQAIRQWRPLFDNVIFSGVMDPSVMRDSTDDAPKFRAQCAFVADGCYAPTFRHCYAWSAKGGFRIVSEGRPEGPEDGAFYRCTANHVRVGIDILTPIKEPQLVIDSCHINSRDIGIRLVKRKFFHVTNNLFYGFDHEGDPPYTDIKLIDCYAGVISQNIFHSPAPDNMKQEPAVERTMIHVDADCRDLIVSDNIFNAKGDSIVIDPGAKNIKIDGSHRSNPHTK